MGPIYDLRPEERTMRFRWVCFLLGHKFTVITYIEQVSWHPIAVCERCKMPAVLQEFQVGAYLREAIQVHQRQMLSEATKNPPELPEPEWYFKK